MHTSSPHLPPRVWFKHRDSNFLPDWAQGCAIATVQIPALTHPFLTPPRVWFKHRDSNFLPAWAQGCAIATVQIPVSLLEACLFSLIMYFMVGGHKEAHGGCGRRRDLVKEGIAQGRV
jgi:hypothetical protein